MAASLKSSKRGNVKDPAGRQRKFVMNQAIKQSEEAFTHTADAAAVKRKVTKKAECAVNPTIVEPTSSYQLESLRRFREDPVTSRIDSILSNKLADVEYDSEVCRSLIVTLTDDILAMVKQFEFDRYKFIVSMYIGEKKKHDVLIVSQGLWDIERDGWASASFENYSVYATASVYALYVA
uniref:Tctex1 domain-containing protein 3-like n=1 Tax=Petromyzon marinus TaxID=7757 RepID=A0AAJ7XD97_PETMA|nr:tctex1 domain-containing protein 3-like [Petromyzon marinus]